MKHIALLSVSALAASAALAQPRLFAVDGTNLVELNPNTGATITSMALTGGVSGSQGALAYDPGTDTLYMASTTNDNLWRIDYNTGAATVIGDFGVGSAVVMHGMEWANGRLYGHSSSAAGGGNFYEINPATGVASVLGTTVPSGSFGSMGWDSVNSVMYFMDVASAGRMLYTMSLTDGALTLVGPNNSGGQAGVGMAFDPLFGMLAISNSGSDTLYSINLATGNATAIGITGTGNALSLAFVPTPGAASLLSLAGLAALRRNRR
ncbi:MAG: hypothetical protein AB7G17_07760 [Phycisphaerales bacterium]